METKLKMFPIESFGTLKESGLLIWDTVNYYFWLVSMESEL